MSAFEAYVRRLARPAFGLLPPLGDFCLTDRGRPAASVRRPPEIPVAKAIAPTKARHSVQAPALTRAVTLLVAGAFFMEMLDGTVITTALPAMGRSFGVGAVSLHVGVTAYLLALGVFIPVSGWLADRFGERRVFAGAIAVFTLASLLCGLCTGLWSFTAARLLQGVGGAAMMPVGRLIVLRMTPPGDRLRAINAIVTPALVAPVLGPPLGGFLVLHFSWPWIFFLNIPLGVAAIALTLNLVPRSKGDAGRSLDWAGFLLSGGALAAFVYGVDTLGDGGGAAIAAAWIFAGLGLGVVGVRHLRRHPTPLLDLAVLRIPTYAAGVWGGSLMRIAIGAQPFLLPLLFQVGFGQNAFAAGALVLFVFAGNLGMKTLVRPILRRFGYRRTLLVNGALAAVAIAACASFTPTTPTWAIAAILFAGGAFRSLQFTSISTLQFADVAQDRLGGANTLAAMVQQLTLGLGVVAGAGLLNLSRAFHGASGTPALQDLRTAFLAMAALVLVGLIDLYRLDPRAGQALTQS